MFGNLLEDLKKQQEALKQKLDQERIEGSTPDGSVTAVVSGSRQLIDIRIDGSKLDWQDREQVLDLIVVAVNEAMEKAAEVERKEGQQLIQSMLPPGLGNLFG